MSQVKLISRSDFITLIENILVDERVKSETRDEVIADALSVFNELPDPQIYGGPGDPICWDCPSIQISDIEGIIDDSMDELSKYLGADGNEHSIGFVSGMWYLKQEILERIKK